MTTAAEVTTFDPPGGVLGWRGLTVGTMLGLFPLAGLVVAVAGNAFLGTLFGPILGVVAGVVAGAGAVVSVVLLLFVATYFADYLPSCYYSRTTRRLIRDCRPDAVVDPADPAVVFIQVIPRANWGRVMVENAADVGFLYADEHRRTLFYEGDAERWVIPAAAVVSIHASDFVVGTEKTNVLNRFTVVVLRFQAPGGVVLERPIGPRHVFPRRRGPKQRHAEAAWLVRLLEAAVD